MLEKIEHHCCPHKSQSFLVAAKKQYLCLYLVHSSQTSAKFAQTWVFPLNFDWSIIVNKQSACSKN